jgi:hypothetical protein
MHESDCSEEQTGPVERRTRDRRAAATAAHLERVIQNTTKTVSSPPEIDRIRLV